MMLFLVLCYALISTAGLLGMKAAPAFMTPMFVVSLLAYGLGALAWVHILRSYPLSHAFPIASTTLIVTTTLAGALFFHEDIGLSHLCGLAFMISGIIILSRS